MPQKSLCTSIYLHMHVRVYEHTHTHTNLVIRYCPEVISAMKCQLYHVFDPHIYTKVFLESLFCSRDMFINSCFNC